MSGRAAAHRNKNGGILYILNRSVSAHPFVEALMLRSLLKGALVFGRPKATRGHSGQVKFFTSVQSAPLPQVGMGTLIGRTKDGLIRPFRYRLKGLSLRIRCGKKKTTKKKSWEDCDWLNWQYRSQCGEQRMLP